jgi:hypothetical protein
VAKIRTLSKSSVINLQRMNDRLNLLEQATSGGRSRYRDSSAHFLVKTPTAGIPALASTTPGSAICTIVKRMSTGLVDTGRDQKVYNLGNAVDGGQIVVVHRDAFGDLWVTDNDAGCEDVPAPGSYAATVGASIAGGSSGPVVYDETVYTAKNQSACNVVIGDLIILHVTQDCELLFTPCVCDCAQEPPTTCCDKKIAVCVNGQIKILAVNGGTAQWSLSDCCDCDSTPTLTITLECTEETVTADWEYVCGSSTYTGSLDYSMLCDDPVVEPVDTISLSGCQVVISATIDAEDCDDCPPPTPEPDPVPTDCCEDDVPGRLFLNMSGSVYAMDYDGSDWVYNGPINGCDTNVIFKIGCDGIWLFTSANQGDNCVFAVNTQSHVSCDPFLHNVSFTVTDPGSDCPCVGSVSATVTS